MAVEAGVLGPADVGHVVGEVTTEARVLENGVTDARVGGVGVGLEREALDGHGSFSRIVSRRKGSAATADRGRVRGLDRDGVGRHRACRWDQNDTGSPFRESLWVGKACRTGKPAGAGADVCRRPRGRRTCRVSPGRC